jgi:signal transduction histidine kinase
VQVLTEGERHDVPPGVDLAAYRIIQEALTNVMKHGGRTNAVVTIRYAERSVSITVDDEGQGAQEPLPDASAGGHGLVGMRERVAAYGGELEAGPRPAGGFRVVARLPFDHRR